MKRNFIHIIWLAAVIILSASCGKEAELPSLRETYSQKDKDPFGAYVFRNQMDQFYINNTLQNVVGNFEKTWREISDTNALYINISKNLFLTTADVDAMLAYVSDGNSLFISSENIDQKLLDSLGCEMSQSFIGQFISEMKYTSVKLQPDVFNDSAGYQYFYIPFHNHFKKISKNNSRILGTNPAGINYLVVSYGNGRFYLHTDPRALSNYFLLQKDNYRYLNNIFSFSPAIPEHVYWDDYYNKKNYARNESGKKSSLAVLLKYPATAWAFWLLLVTAVLYIFFGGKRRQRILPTIPANENTTLAFTETISRLYLQKKDNKNIADKLITYLMEYIRNQYYLNTSQINDDFIGTLSRKSNNTKEGTARLFKSIGQVHQSIAISDQQLLTLNQQVENFYKNNI